MEITAPLKIETVEDYIAWAGPVLDLLPDPIRFVDLQGITKYVNRAFLQMTGFSPTELINRPLIDIYMEDERERIRSTFASVIKTGNSGAGSIEAHIIRKGGNPILGSLKAVAIRNSKNEPIGGLAMFRDFSRISRILTEPLELLMLSGSPVEVLRQLPARVATYFPGRPWVMINLVEGEYLRFAYAMNVPSELMAMGGEPLNGSICGIPIQSREFLGITDMTEDERVRQDPCVTQFGCRGYLGYPIIHSSGHVLGTICVLRPTRGGFGEFDHRIMQMFSKRAAIEIERMELEQKSDESERGLRELVENAPILLWRMGLQGQFDVVSRKVRTDFGLAPHGQIGGTLFDIIHADDIAEVRTRIEAAIQGPKPEGLLAFSIRFRKSDGEYKPFFTTFRPSYDINGKIKLFEAMSFELPADE